MEDPGLLSAFIDNLVSRLFSLAEEKYNLYKGFEGDVTFLMRELPMITSAIDGQLLGHDDHILRLTVDELRHCHTSPKVENFKFLSRAPYILLASLG